MSRFGADAGAEPVNAGRTEIELCNADERHTSLAGTCLGACEVYAAVTGKTPVGNRYTAGLDPALASYLQKTAWDTVQSHYAK